MQYSIKVIVLASFYACCVSDVSNTQQFSDVQMGVEFRLAESRPAAGLKESIVPGSNSRVYLYREAIVTEKDILTARGIEGDGSQFEVLFVFSSEGAKKMAAATKAHLNKPLAILIDGKLVAAPILTSAIEDTAALSFRSREDADRIAKAIGVTSLFMRDLIDSRGKVAVEFRLAERLHSKGLTEAVVSGTLQRVFLHEEILISNRDVVTARVVEGYKEGIFDVELTLTKEARDRIVIASQSHEGKMLAVLINARVASAGFIIGKLSSPIGISGEFTKQEAEAIVKTLNER